MQEKKKTNKVVVILAVVLALALAASAIVFFATRPSTEAGEKTVTVLVLPAAGETQTYTLHTNEEYLGALLLAEGIASGDVSEYGLFITEAGGITADAQQQQWWCITKGGEDVMTGADTTPIADGDVFELTLMTGW